jgi:hypothetical protein
MLLAFFPLAFVALLRGLDSLTAAVLAILVTALVAFSLPLIKKVSRENSDHFAIAAFYIAIVMGLVLFLMVGDSDEYKGHLRDAHSGGSGVFGHLFHLRAQGAHLL